MNFQKRLMILGWLCPETSQSWPLLRTVPRLSAFWCFLKLNSQKSQDLKEVHLFPTQPARLCEEGRWKANANWLLSCFWDPAPELHVPIPWRRTRAGVCSFTSSGSSGPASLSRLVYPICLNDCSLTWHSPRTLGLCKLFISHSRCL